MKVQVKHNAVFKFALAGFILGIFILVSRAQMVSPFNLPLYFEGSPGRNEILSRGSGYQFLITSGGAQIALCNAAGRVAKAQMSFAGGNSRATVYGDGELPGKINYLIGNDPSKWQTGLPMFSKVQVSEIYPGINLVFHGNEQQLEYDFDIAPGVNPGDIKIHFDGIDKMSVTPQGELVLKLGSGEIRQPKPEIFQASASGRHVIEGGYRILDARTVAFDIGRYDHSLPLVIDPLLGFSSYFGGSLGTIAWAIARDNTNDFTYIAGQTFSTKFFTTGA
ncbi:MAG TPA: hypothetical protein VMH87_17050, partial [Pseudomonadales bacterium]|nr:hypothetical protein [Pseudomonadales bacterium]